MKKIKNFTCITLLLSLLGACKAVADSDKTDFLNQFFNNNIVHSSLKGYYDGNVIVYDANKVLTSKPLQYVSDSLLIKIENKEPSNEKYFKVYDFVLNKDLGFIVLSTADDHRGILYYLKKSSRNNKWSIMELKKRYSR